MATQKRSTARKSTISKAKAKLSAPRRRRAARAGNSMKEVREMGHNVVSSIKSVLPGSLKSTASRRKAAGARKANVRKRSVASVTPLRSVTRTRRGTTSSARARRAA